MSWSLVAIGLAFAHLKSVYALTKGHDEPTSFIIHGFIEPCLTLGVMTVIITLYKHFGA